MKILALYLPQFHQTDENDRWWGVGYTEWSAVKAAKPLYPKHQQPRVPLNQNYYDLADESAETWKWQAELASNYGIHGFCVYHYWFKGKQILERPMEILLRHPEINLPYCFCWANESWTRTWYGLENEILLDQTYGEEADWKRHFDYLLKFFQDPRYIKVDGMPLVNIYKSADIVQLEEMLACWRGLAKAVGFPGLYVVVSNSANHREDRSGLIDGYYDFEPGFSTKDQMNLWDKTIYYGSIATRSLLNQILKTSYLERRVNIVHIYERILKNYRRDRVEGRPTFPGLFPMWDNSPRRGYKSTVYFNHSPELFEKALTNLAKQTKEDDFIYINAWNEWGEGCYLEPDTVYQHAFLEAISAALAGGKT